MGPRPVVGGSTSGHVKCAHMPEKSGIALPSRANAASWPRARTTTVSALASLLARSDGRGGTTRSAKALGHTANQAQCSAAAEIHREPGTGGREHAIAEAAS